MLAGVRVRRTALDQIASAREATTRGRAPRYATPVEAREWRVAEVARLVQDVEHGIACSRPRKWHDGTSSATRRSQLARSDSFFARDVPSS